MSRSEQEALRAVIRSHVPPTESQTQRLEKFLSRTRQRPVTLSWEEDASIDGGFRLQVGGEVYDWTLEGRLRQFQERLEQLDPGGASVIPLMKETVANWSPEICAEETGCVLTVGDEIATVSGLEHAAYGEILLFSSGVKGMVQDLKRGEIGCILFGSGEEKIGRAHV